VGCAYTKEYEEKRVRKDEDALSQQQVDVNNMWVCGEYSKIKIKIGLLSSQESFRPNL